MEALLTYIIISGIVTMIIAKPPCEKTVTKQIGKNRKKFKFENLGVTK